MQKHKVTRKIETPAEYKEAVKAADTLGLEPDRAEFFGTWVSDEGHPCWPKEHEIEKIGRKYFTVKLDGRLEKIEPEGGHLRVAFR